MPITDEKVKTILLKSGFVKEEELDKAIKVAHSLEKPLLDILLFRGVINDDLYGQLIAEEFKVPYANLRHRSIPLEILGLVPEKMARTKKVIPFEKNGKNLSVAMEDPGDLETIELIQRKTGLKVDTHYATPYSMNRALSQYKKNIKLEFESIINENIKKTGKYSDQIELNKVAADLPVIRILNTVLEYGMAEGASDVHMEQMENSFIIRMRIDGVLRDIISLSKDAALALIARIKILANLKIDEHRIPQDGRFKYMVGEDRISLRVSILPGFYGENTVLRLLFESARPLSLEELGITSHNLQIIKDAIHQPHGMLLVTGPTGSGKTTTLYSILNMLNSTEVKICTIEDPVEYDLNRLTQIQVNASTGVTFSSGLRSLLRHDPDIIMVGEIRDRETAEIAIHSALTGHLVLSTLHTNDAPSTIPRLLDMGAEGFLLTATLNIVIAQRLVRKICSKCIREVEADSSKITNLRKVFPSGLTKQKFYAGKGCDECGQTGYKGRIGLYEVLYVDEEIQKAILAKRSPEEIRKAAEKQGMISMFQDGINKIAAGMTTIEEVLRVVEEN